MKVLQLIQKPQLRGAEIFACQLSEQLISTGIQSDVAYLFANEGTQLNFELTFVSLEGSQQKRFWDIKGYRNLARLVRQGQYDIVQANAGDTLKYAVLSRLIFGWKAKLVFRNANRMSGFIRSGLQRWINVWLLRKCDFFISVSENSRQDLIGLYPAARQHSVTIPIGTYETEVHVPVARNVPKEEPVFISIGSFVPEKNQLFLLDIFHRYFERFGNGVLWLVGDGKLRGQLEQRVGQLKISERVHFWGYRSNVMEILKAADIFVLPSLIEGLPAVLLEAILCDVPVVASAVGGIPEIIENGVTGICIQGWDADEYVEAIASLLQDPLYKKRVAAAAKTRLLAAYTLKKVALDFTRQYERLV